MKNLEKLTKEIRSKLPDLMELKDGCLIRNKLNSFTYKVIENNYCLQLYSFEFSSFKTLEFSDLKNFEILGSEPQLNDVLRWLGKDYAIDGDGNLLKFIDLDCAITRIKVDLSKPYLKDQRKELIDSLAVFIK